ncbi:MAG: hypothetical protein P0Y65_05305 [Candidatus Devosia phytovorans]|uniref:Carboxypeptidase regulatory-like domain-containing protein n=1 Tax=Candidatus Devosia phytovorans TaxID=3121372 RepID=A0AAJ5VYA2_9HYPH|nr:hypothetical protein [Devosia sp.]WEK05672.1 MAG: hypothetical protein P0Y65_05305 [Devosia sp.]
MRLRPLLTILLALASVTPALVPFATVATAQETGGEAAADLPPLPRPRPDPASLPATPPQAEQPSQTPATEAITAITSAPQPVQLNARITEDGTTIPDGLVWRIFDTQPDASGELALAAKSEEGEPELELPPGEYMVHVAYGRAQTSEPLSVVPGQNEKTFVLDAGALRLNSAVTGDVSIPPDLLKFDIYTAGEENDRAMVAENLSANEIVTLNAGTYHIVSRFGVINAVVRADLRVEAGQLTDATLYHHASQVAFKLVSEAGGEAIADVEWTVKTADGATVFAELSAFPSTVLSEGDYLVLAKQGSQVFNREFQVQPGALREIEVLTTVY